MPSPSLPRVGRPTAMQSFAAAREPVLPTDFRLCIHIAPRSTFEWSKVLLARGRLDGTLELLTAVWEQVLGYGRYELDGKTLSDLMWSGKAAAAGAVAAILDELDTSPVELTLCSRSGEAKSFRLYRRFDAYASSMFIVADDIPPTRDCAAFGSAREAGPPAG